MLRIGGARAVFCSLPTSGTTADCVEFCTLTPFSPPKGGNRSAKPPPKVHGAAPAPSPRRRGAAGYQGVPPGMPGLRPSLSCVAPSGRRPNIEQDSPGGGLPIEPIVISVLQFMSMGSFGDGGATEFDRSRPHRATRTPPGETSSTQVSVFRQFPENPNTEH